MNEEERVVYCESCGEELLCKTDTSDGDMAWFIYDKWWCDDCAESIFRREVTE